MSRSNEAAQKRLQAITHFEKRVYPLQDRILAAVRDAHLPFYLSGETALHRFILSGRYTHELEYIAEPGASFRESVARAADAIAQALAGSAQLVAQTENHATARLFSVKAGGEPLLALQFRANPAHHVDGVLPGGIFLVPGCGKLDYWLNILADIVARAANRGIADLVDTWWLSKNYSFSWASLIDHASKKTAALAIQQLCNSLIGATETDLGEIHWIIERNNSEIMHEFSIIAREIGHGLENSLAPEPADEQ